MKASLVWAGVALVAIVAGVGYGLAAAGRSDAAVLGWMVGMGTFAGTAFGLLAKLEHKTDGQTQQLADIQESVDTVQHRVNGELDMRIAAAMEEAAETGAARAIAVLRREGVIR